MLNDEIYFFGLLIIGVVIVIIAMYGVNRWYMRKNRIESIHEQKELSKSNGSHSNQNQFKET